MLLGLRAALAPHPLLRISSVAIRRTRGHFHLLTDDKTVGSLQWVVDLNLPSLCRLLDTIARRVNTQNRHQKRPHESHNAYVVRPGQC